VGSRVQSLCSLYTLTSFLLVVLASVTACGGTRAGWVAPPESARTVSSQREPPLEGEAIVGFIDHLASVRHDRLVLQAQFRDFSQAIGQRLPIFSAVPEKELVEMLADDYGPSSELAMLTFRASRAKTVLAVVDGFSKEYAELRDRAMDPQSSQEDSRLRQVGLLYAVALGLEGQAVRTWGEVTVYGSLDMGRVAQLLEMASRIYTHADDYLSENLAEDALLSAFASEQVRTQPQARTR